MSSLPPPLAMVLELTHRCALGCAYCSNPVSPVPRAAELAVRDWLAVLDQAAELGVLQLHLSGGEPLLYSDLESLVARAAARDLYTNLITSGVPASRERLARLAQAGLAAVQLSLQDVDREASDRQAGLASFDKKLEFAHAVRRLGLPLTINVVITRENADRAPRVLELALELGARRIELAHAQYHGFARLNRARLMPSFAQVQAVRALADRARGELAGRAELIHVVPDHFARYPKRCMGGWGSRSLVIAPDGVALPCHAARGLPLEFETVTDTPLSTIWRESPAFARFRGSDFLDEPCKSCERRELDLGGCRCQAFELTGRLTAADPACALSPDHGLVVAARAEHDVSAPHRPRRLPLLA